MYIDKQPTWKNTAHKLSTCYSLLSFCPYITFLLNSASLNKQNLYVGARLSAVHGMVVSAENLILLQSCFGIGLVLFFKKKGREPFLLSALPSLEGLQINRWKEKTKIIVDFSCGKIQQIPVRLLTPASTCLLGLSSYVASLHWGKTWLRRILKWANAESRWQTLAAMISSLIICTACCGRRPARPANRRAQEGRESVLSHLQEAAWLSVKTPISIGFTHHSYLVKCKCRSSEPWTLIRAELRKSNIVLYITPWNWV